MKRHGLLLACMAGLAFAAPAAELAQGVINNVVFTQYGSVSSSTQLMRRLVTPLNAWRLQQRAAATGTAIVDQPIDLTRERFALYVPAQAPPDGYALLVFVPPWNEARVPTEWTSVLERHGMIFVTAANIGNDASLLDRRDPVALLAAVNVMAQYRVNPQRVYVSGFSGGSRVALRLALGYPDLFRGALLEAGSDPIGQAVPLPPQPLLEQFQTNTRIVYFTGQQDPARMDVDRQSRHSLHEWCVDDVDLRTIPSTGHDLAGAVALDRALTSLETHHPPDASRLDACRANIASELDHALAAVDAAVARNDVAAAQRDLDELDQRFGGLAAPRSVERATRLLQAAPPSH
jgi:dienelactone hydrolase